MNKVYNVIWSEAQKAWVVVAEGTKRRTKSAATGLKVIVALIMLSPGAGWAATLPQGGVISVGEGTIINSGSNQLIIKQNSDKLGVNWQSFNVGADGRVVFEQPNANSVALNRVVGSDGSSILGKIDANGQVILVNPNGVMFGKDSQVNVGGLVASTLDISDKDFKDGNYTFTGGSNAGAVVNQGTLKAAEGGYVALIGKSVKNQGLIQATLGTAAMAAGDSVTLDMSGDGLINLQVKKAAVGALLDNQGVIIADGGQALMTARAANALTETVINNDGIIRAQTINNKAGKIFLDGGPVDGDGTLTVGGTLDASAPVSGDGGFIDTSAKTVTIKEGAKVTTASKNGKFGTWLIDPTNFAISYGSAAQTSSGIGSLTLQSALASSNVSIATSASGTDLGDIGIYNADLTWSANTVLTLTAHNNIVLNSYAINVNGANGGLVLNYAGSLVLNGANAKINLNGASATFAQNGVNYTIIRNLTDLQNVQSNLGGDYAIGADFSAAASSSMNGGLGFNPLGDATTPFTGEIQGLGHTISGLYINRPTTDYVGLIGYADGAKVQDIKLTGFNISGRSYVGGVAGYFSNSNSLRSNLQGNVSGVDYVGGLYGYGDASSTISWDISDVKTTASGDNVGGIAGYYAGMGYYLTSTGQVSGHDDVGGVFGSATGTLHDSYSTSTVSGHANVGGLVGYASALNLYNTYSRGAVSGSLATGGLVGRAVANSTISTSFSYSPVTGNGGLVGELDSSSLTNTYAVGDVVGGSGAGLVGSSVNSTIDKSYATGKATYGLVGSATTSTITNSFWDMDTSGTTLSNGGTGKTAAQMKQAATFAGWSLDKVYGAGLTWRVYEGQTGPLLTFMMPRVNISSFSGTYNGTNQVVNAVSPMTVTNSIPFWVASTASIALPNIEFMSGGAAVKNAGTYNISGTPIYSNQFGWNLNTVSTNLTVNKLTLNASVIIANLKKTYDGTNSVRDDLYTASNIIAGDEVIITTPDAVYSTKNAGSSLRIDYGVSQLSGANAANYELPYALYSGTSYTLSGTILKRAVTLGAVGIDKTYDGTTNGSANLTFGGLIGSDSVTGSATSTVFSDKNAGANKTLTVSGITLSGADAANYTVATSISTTATINKANLVITAVGSDKTYDGTTSASLSSLTTNKLAGDTVTISGGTAAFADKNAGAGKTVTVSGYTVSGADAGNYAWNTSTVTTATINKAILNVSASASNKTYNGNNLASVVLGDNRIAGDNLTLSNTSATFSDKNAANGKTVTVNGISVDGADAANYIWNTSTTATANITKADLNLAVTGGGKVYDGNTSTNVSLTDARVAGDDLSITYTASFADKNAGANKAITVNGITVTGADASNYNVVSSLGSTATISKAVLDISATATDKTYDGSVLANTTILDDRIAGDDLSVIYGSSTFDNKNVGVGKTVTISGISVTGADAGNYTWVSSKTTSADINARRLEVTGTVNDKVYDGTSSATISDLSDDRISGDDLNLTSTGATFADKNAGSNKTVTVSGINVTGADAANYTWDAQVTTTASITKALLDVTATVASKNYDGTTDTTAVLSDNRISGDDLDLSYGTAQFQDKNAGVSKNVDVTDITITGADAGNYTWNTSISETADIGKAILTISSSGVDKTYDGTKNAQVSFSDDRKGSDDLVISANTVEFSDKNAGDGKQISVSGITITGADADNYIWDSSSITTADITKAALNVSISATDKVYDGNTTASTTLSDNRIAGDDLIISNTTSTFSDKNAGTAKVVTVNGISITGADADNYTWNATATTTADIDKAQLGLVASADDRVYDGTTGANAHIAYTSVAGDVLTITYDNADFSDKNAGAGKSVSVSGINVTGAEAGNYDWSTSLTTAATIQKASLAITATAQDKVYDGSALATTSLSDNRIGADDLVISSTGSTFSDKNAADGKLVTVNGITVTGADAGNYTWSNSVITTADIAKANLSVTATADGKTYDGTTTVNTTLADNRIGSDDLVISSTAVFADKNAGVAKLVNVDNITLTGADADNYTWNTSTTTSADIAKAQLDITSSAGDRTYNGTTLASASLSDNRIAGDDLNLSFSQADFADKNAGTNKVVTVKDIAVTGADAGNYEWDTTSTTTADISKATLSISADGVDKTYDGTTNANAILSDNRFGSDDLTINVSGIQFADKNAGTGKQVTVSGITVTGTDAQNYTWDASVLTTADISKAVLNVSATASDKTYDGTKTVSTVISDDRIGADDLTISASSEFADKNAGIGKLVTVNGITVTGDDADNYTWNASTTTTADIAKAYLDITADAVSRNYDGTTQATAVLSDDRIAGDDVSVNYGQADFADKNAGVNKVVTVNGITVTGADAGNYTWNATNTATADIGKAVLSITASGVDKTYDGTNVGSVTLADNRFGADDLTLSASDVQFADKNAGTGKQVSVSGISVTGADADNYIWDSNAYTTADINKAVLNVSATAADKTYDGTKAVSTTISDNRIGSDVLTITSSAEFADKNAGLDKLVTVDSIAVTGADAGNYTWNTTTTTTADIGKASLQIDASATNKTYDGSTAALSSLSDNRISGDNLVISAADSSFADKNAGTNKVVTVSGIAVTGADAGNYDWNTTATTTADISKATLVVTATGQDKTYDGSTLASTNLSDNRISGDSLVISTTGSSFADKNAGANKTVTVNGISLSGADAQNYTWNTTASTTASIAKANLVVSAIASDKVYDGSTAASSGLSDNRIGTDDLTLSSTSSTFSDKNAGNDKVVTVNGILVTGADAGNYTWNASTTTTADIAKAQLNVTADAATKNYDTTRNADVVFSDDRISGDNLSVSSGQALFDTKNAGTGKVVSVDGITVSGADADNYTWNTSTTTTADIGKAILSVTATGVDKTYDGTTTGSVIFSDDRLGADDLTLTASDIQFEDKNAGAGKQVTVSGITVTGADAQNYIWDSNVLATADINKAVLNVSAAAAGKTYDGTTSVSTVISDDRIGADDLVITANTQFADKNAGTGKLVIVDGITVAGADAGNYTWNTDANTTADIAKAQLQIDASATNKTYDGSTAAISSLSDNRIAGDNLVISAADSSFSDKNAGTNKLVTVSGINVTGADAGNYDWNVTDTTTADISKANLVVSATGQNKTYDGSTLATTTLSDNRIGADDLVISTTGSSFADKNAGANKTVTVNGITLSGADAQNYTWNATATTTADIAKANLVIGAVASDKVYDGTTAASTTLSDNRIGTDALTVSAASSTFSDKNAGDNKLVTVDGIVVTGADAANYNWNTEATTTADIAKAQLHVTMDAADKTYDATRNASVAFSDDRISGDVISVGSNQALFDTKNAGTGKTVSVDGITLTGADAGNYTWNVSTSATADVGKAVLSITATGVDKTYDGTTAGAATLGDDRFGNDDLTLSASDIQFVDKNAATGKQVTVSGIVVTGADAGNYIWDTSVLTTADINKAVLNVSATAADKTYDGTTAVSTTISDNRIGADDLIIVANAAFGDKNAGADKLVNVDNITVTGADAGNYTWNSSTTTTADIAKAHLDITSSAADRTYNGTTVASAGLSDNRIAGDDLSLSFSQADFVDKNAGNNKVVTVKGIAVTGADAGNYQWDTTSTTSANIAKAVLTVTASGVDKTYDSTTAGSATLSDNRFGSDNLILSASNVQFADKNAGTGKQVSVSGISVSGADAGNYIWNTNALTTADISKAVLNVSATASNKTYDGTKTVSTVISDDRIGADDLTISASSEFADKNAGTGKLVTVNGITVTGADAGNYVWNTSTATTADIAKASLVVTSSAANRNYDGTTQATAALSDNRIAGDDLGLSYGQAVFADKNAGVGKTVTVNGIAVTGTDAGNYTWNLSSTATADIGKAVLSITAAGVNKVYDGSVDASATFTDNRFGADDLTITAADARFVDKNAGTGKQVTVMGINVTGADAANYLWDTNTTTTADIAKAVLNVSAVASDKVYDGTSNASTILTDNRALGDDLVLSSTSSSFSDKNAGNDKTVSVGGIAVSGTDAGNYTWNTGTTTTADIAKATLVVDATGVNKTYDSTTSASATLSDNRISGDTLTVGYGNAQFIDKNAGAGKLVTVSGITVTGADAGNYTWNSIDTTSANIAKATLLVTAAGVNKTYDGSVSGTAVLSDSRFANDDLLLSAASVAFADKNAGAGKAVSVGGITVTGADAQNYVWNTTAATTASIAKAVLTVGATAQNKVYDTTTSATFSLTDNRVAGDQLTISGSGAFSNKNAGVGKTVTVNGISVTGADAGNYTWNSLAVATADITKATLVISAVANDKTYDGSTTATTTLSDNRLGSDNLVLSATGSNFNDKNAGAGKAVTVNGLSVSGADAGNYTWNTSASTTATVNKAVLTVTGAAADKIYDGSRDATVTLSDNRIGTDNLVITAGNTQFADKNAGINKVVSIDGIAVAGADAVNYTWNSSASTTADIAKATLLVAANAQDKTYDGTVNASTTLTDNRIAGDDLVINTTGSAFSDKNAGVDKVVTVNGVSLSGADADNYLVASTAATTATINKAVLNVVADAASKTYDGSTATTATLSDDRIAGDSLMLNYGTATFADKNAGASKTVSVNGISLSGADAMNYTWNVSTTDTASIAKANLAITATGLNKIYDGSTAAGVILNDNRVVGDQLTLSSSGATFADKNAGTAKTVTAYGVTVTGADANNYVWNTSAITTADITKRVLQVAAGATNKTYDGTTHATITLSDDRIVGDDLVLSAADAAFDSKNAGVGKTVAVDGITVIGADAGNYAWNSTATTTADVAKAQLTVTATAADKVYNGNTAATSTYSDNRLAGDDLTVNAASSTFQDKNAGVGKTVTVSGITLSGADADNYTVNSVAVATATINKAVLNVSATGGSKTYDGTTSAQVSLTDNRVAGDNLAVTNTTAAYADKNAGSGKTITVGGISVGGADAANYTWNTTAITLGNIAKARLVISGVVQDKVYDGSTSATVGSLSDNRVTGDDLAVSAAGASFQDKNAGTNKEATINGLAVAGADAGNYIWDSVSVTAAEIVKAYLQLAATGQNKGYDGTSNASISVTDNRVAGDQLTVNVGSALFDDKNAGSNKAITASDLSLTGADAGNYTFADSLTTQADINKADLTVSVDQIKKVKGQQDPALTWKVKDGVLFAGDVLTGALTRVEGEEVGTYAVEQGTLSAGENYNLTFVPGEMTITNAAQQAPEGYEKAVSAAKKSLQNTTKIDHAEMVDLSLGYKMLNLGIKMPEQQLGDAVEGGDGGAATDSTELLGSK